MSPGNSQPTPSTRDMSTLSITRNSHSQPTPSAASACDNEAVGNSQPISARDTTARNSPPKSSPCRIATGNSQPMSSACDVAVGNSQPMLSARDMSAGNSQPMTSACDMSTGNSQPMLSSRDMSTGNSQPMSSVCDVAVGNSQTTSICDENVASQSSVEVTQNDGPPADEETTHLSDDQDDLNDENKNRSQQDQQLSQPDIYSLMSNSNDDEDLHPERSPERTLFQNQYPLELVSAGSSTNFNQTVEDLSLPPPTKRRRILGELQQEVPSANKKINAQKTTSFKKDGKFTKKSEELHFVPSGGFGGCVINLDASSSKDGGENNKRNHKGFEIHDEPAVTFKTDVINRTHAAIRVDPQTQVRLRLGLSKRRPIPSLHPNRVRRSSNEENEN